MPALLAILLCAATGWCAVRLALPRPSKPDHVLTACLAGPFGLAVFSLDYFAWRLFSNSRAALIGIDVTVLSALVLLLVWRTRTATPQPRLQTRTTTSNANRIVTVLWVVFVATVAIALYCCIRLAEAEPEGGGWDAFAIWNLHARFLFLGGEHWRNGFTSLIPWSHPDYPLMLPAAIAHFWTYMKNDPEYVPAGIALVFTFSTAGLLYAAVRALRGSSQALLAGIILLSSPFFLRQGVSQYADVPLAFFIVATILFTLLNSARPAPRWLAMAGMTAALAAWTKNEGLLFCCAFLTLFIVEGVRQENWAALRSRIAPLLLGAAPVLLVLAWFKFAVAPSGDLFTSSATMLAKIADPARYWLILRWFLKEVFLFSGWPLITVILAVYAHLLGAGLPRKYKGITAHSAAALGLTLAGYFAVYVITPYDLKWHLRFSLDRLFLQLWPSALLLFFMIVRTPEQWLAQTASAPAATPTPLPERVADQAA